MEELEQEVTEEVEAAPEPVEAAPEPAEEFDYEPEFFSEEPPQHEAPQQQQQQWSPQQVEAYNQYVAQQSQQVPQAQPPQTEQFLDRFLRNPDGTISEVAAQQARQIAENMMYQTMGPIAAQQQQFIRGQAQYHTRASDENIKSMYKGQFNKDESFASNPRVRQRVDSAIAGLRQQAISQAMMGDPSGFAIFSQPTFAKSVLALAKIMEGDTPAGVNTGAAPHVERTAPAAQARPQQLDPETEAAIAHMPEAWKERYREEQANAEKFGDFEG